jgi:CHAT domain-containing protein
METTLSENWIAKLLAIEDRELLRAALLEQVQLIGERELARQLKQQADQWLRADIQRCLKTGQLLLSLAELTGDPRHRALGLLAQANAQGIGLGEYELALGSYDQAARIYQENGYLVEQASAQIGKIGVLQFLARYQEALQTGKWAAEVLQQAGEWLSLAKIVSNTGVIKFRLGNDTEALADFEHAQRLYERLGMEDSPGWLRVEINRAIVLRNLGRFDASIHSSQIAYQKLIDLSQDIEAARPLQNLALTYFVLGRYNEALNILDQVRTIFLSDERQRDAILTELFISDCLLYLRRFREVLDKCCQLRQDFTQLGTQFEVGLAILNEAVAYAGLKQYDDALESLVEARRIFDRLGNQPWVEYANLEIAALYHKMDQFEQSCQVALASRPHLENQPLKHAQANLIAARALLSLDRLTEMEPLLGEALQVGQANHIAALTYAAHTILGKLAERQGDPLKAMSEYDQAIQDLEKLRGRMMIEFRADFLEDKQSLYEDMVALCIDLGHSEEGFQYAERAKSRALLEMIAYRLDLRISALAPEDRGLANELVQLRAERDRLYRRWESNAKETMRMRGGEDYHQEINAAQAEVLAIENKITAAWHKLLVRNAGYARDASLWQVRVEPIQPLLQDGSLLLEYYFTYGQVVLFLVSQETIRVVRLSSSLPQVQRLLQMLWLNWKTVPRSLPERRAALSRNAAGILGQLYNLLLAPAAETISAFRKLLIVPHGPLHYLPFHTLFDGQDYLVREHQISYLPAASFLQYCQEIQPAESGFLVAGNSYNGRLSYTLEEAAGVARLWGRQPLLEEEVSKDNLQQKVLDCRGLHLAAHGSFRSDNPLFSGLALADGWLTTLDIFNLRLRASLVTLSACETGRSVLGGGDELLGLMRAFLYAGAASLVLSQWAVDDRSTALFMDHFYSNLKRGLTKGESLRQAQLAFLPDAGPGFEHPAEYSHPYFWAPFFLVGDSGAF